MTWRSLYSTPTGLALGVLLALILVSIYAALERGVDLARLGGRTLGFYLLTSAVAAGSGTLLGLWFSRGVVPGLLDLERLISNLAPPASQAAVSR